MEDGARVVITGLGVIAPNGIGAEPFWKALLEGRAATARVGRYQVDDYTRQHGAEVHGFSPEAHLPAAQAAGLGSFSQYAIVAGRMALRDAGLDPAPEGVALVLGTIMAEIQVLERISEQWAGPEGVKAVTAEEVRRYSPAAVLRSVANGLGLEGARGHLLNTACTSGIASITDAVDLLRAGEAEVAVVGSVDVFSRVNLAAFARVNAMAKERCQPFDKNRGGMMLGEGAAVFVLETLAGAKRRGARIHGELAGYGLTCDAGHITAPETNGAGLARSMREAMAMARVDADQIAYVGAHGTGTKANDEAEARAIVSVFGDRATPVPVSSIKSMIGHSMGAANGHQLAATLLAMRDGWIPPTIHHETPDPECPIDCVPNHARQLPVEVALINGVAFGGNNASLVVRRVA